MATVQDSSGTPSRRDAAFASIFPPHDHTVPTPETTPNLGTLASPGAPFGGFNVATDVAGEAARVNRAWSIATRFLSITPGSQSGRNSSQSTELTNALIFLLGQWNTNNDLRKWYIDEIRDHFQRSVLPELRVWEQPIAITEAATVLGRTAKALNHAQQLYLDKLSHLKGNAAFQTSVRAFAERIKKSFHLLALHSLPSDRILKTIASFCFHAMKASLESSPNISRCLASGRCSCKPNVDLKALANLREVGLGDSIGERALALAVHRLLVGPGIERRCFEVDWSSKQSVKSTLTEWATSVLSPIVEKAVLALTFSHPERLVTQLETIAVSKLGLLRIRSLFDYVKRWPHSQGAILDIREYLAVTGAAEKAQLCSSFSEQTNRRLLHAGASTVEILSIYINVIHVFKMLDSRGVLFEKVAIPIRHYLRSRDDTATIIAASFLAEADENGEVKSQDMDKICVDIALEISTSALQSQDDHSLRWDDMEWLPDPIDAGPDYKSSKTDDIVAYVLALFEQDEFIKELLTFLGQHFLRSSDMEFTMETRLIELLKARLDPSKLQAAEVMLKDMRDSKLIGKRINPRVQAPLMTPPTPREIQAAIPSDGITLAALYGLFEDRMKRTQFVAAVRLVANRRNDLYFPKRTRLPPDRSQTSTNIANEGPEFSVKVLSGFFWPSLRGDVFELPGSMQAQMIKYQENFARLGGQRRVEWRPALCTVNVELALEDRTVDEKNLPAWRASVVNYFACASDQELADGLTVSQLCESLKMDEELVNDALSFWLGKRVLYQKEAGKYAVLERLDMEVESVVLDQQAPEAIMVKSQDALLREGAPMFEPFIKSMLQNSGPKEIGGMFGITGMLKMVLPTFTYGDDGVSWLLGQMESRGEVIRNGDTWAIPK